MYSAVYSVIQWTTLCNIESRIECIIQCTVLNRDWWRYSGVQGIQTFRYEKQDHKLYLRSMRESFQLLPAEIFTFEYWSYWWVQRYYESLTFIWVLSRKWVMSRFHTFWWHFLTNLGTLCHFLAFFAIYGSFGLFTLFFLYVNLISCNLRFFWVTIYLPMFINNLETLFWKHYP